MGTTPGNRRALRFESPDAALADARAIAAAERAGRARRSGNWTPGQVFNHLAAWINFGFDGYPLKAPADLAARALARKDHALEHGLMENFRIPGIDGGTAATEVVPLDEGLARLEQAWSRLAASTPAFPHPFFGPLTRDEWFKLHLRHSELHQSFLHPEV